MILALTSHLPMVQRPALLLNLASKLNALLTKTARTLSSFTLARFPRFVVASKFLLKSLLPISTLPGLRAPLKPLIYVSMKPRTALASAMRPTTRPQPYWFSLQSFLRVQLMSLPPKMCLEIPQLKTVSWLSSPPRLKCLKCWLVLSALVCPNGTVSTPPSSICTPAMLRVCVLLIASELSQAKWLTIHWWSSTTRWKAAAWKISSSLSLVNSSVTQSPRTSGMASLWPPSIPIRSPLTPVNRLNLMPGDTAQLPFLFLPPLCSCPAI